MQGGWQRCIGWFFNCVRSGQILRDWRHKFMLKMASNKSYCNANSSHCYSDLAHTALQVSSEHLKFHWKTQDAYKDTCFDQKIKKTEKNACVKQRGQNKAAEY